MTEFDALAATWDENPMHLERTKAIAGKLLAAIPLNQGMSALEFGAGTGLLSLELRDMLSDIILTDSSRQMVSIIEQKIRALGIENMQAKFIDLQKENFEGKFDIIYSQMVFHHVDDIDGILLNFNELLNPGGYIAIADLYTEDGTFHDDSFTGHKGFDVKALSATIENQGFTDIHHAQCFIIRKSLKDAGIREYPVFLLTAKKI